MASRQPTVEVVAILAPSLLHGRTRLGQKLQDLVQSRHNIPESKLSDGTVRGPAIRLAVQEAPPAPGQQQERLSSITWRVSGRPAAHVLVCFRPQEFRRAVDGGLADALQAAERLHPGLRLHLLTWDADAGSERLWQLAADLAVWRPDVDLHCARNLEEAAGHAYRLTRAVGEEAWKQTTTRSYLSALPQLQSATEKRKGLETLLARHGVERSGPAAALMRALLALPGVMADAAYAVGLQYGSLQALLEAVERDGGAATQAALARLPLPASTAVVGPAAAERIAQFAAPG